MQAITYRGQTVAAATVWGLFLCARLACRPVGDPERTFVIYMGVYAADVLRGELPGPYSDEQARCYARVALIPGELLEHDLPCLEDTAPRVARAGRRAAPGPRPIRIDAEFEMKPDLRVESGVQLAAQRLHRP